MRFPISTLGEKLSYRLARHLPTATWRANRAGAIVSFTFDDVPASAASEGAPILEGLGVRGTYYLCGGLLGGQGDLTPLLDRGQGVDLLALVETTTREMTNATVQILRTPTRSS